MHRRVYDLAALVVVLCLGVMLLGVGARMLTGYAEGATEDGGTAAAPKRPDLSKLTRAERDALRDRDGVVWGMQIDWASLYPPQETPAAAATALDRFAAWLGRERFQPYESRVESVKQLIDRYASDYAPAYRGMVELANRYDTLIGWSIVDMASYNPVVMAEDNYFITCVARQDRAARAAEIIALREFCAARGTRHLYVTTPNDACRYDKDIAGVTDFYNQNADRLQKALRQAGVETIDLRDALHAAGMEHHRCFYQTDHHWRPETGRWAAGVIAARLNADYGFAIDGDLFAPERWREEVYEDWFLGSQGKKVTLARARPEDFSLWYPTFDTAFHLEIPSLDVDRHGDFSVFYRYNALRTRDYYGQSPYSAYLYGDQALTRIHNENCGNGTRVLMLGHSFDNCVVPFLALGVEYLDAIDLREFTGSLATYLDENRYDVVIELYTE